MNKTNESTLAEAVNVLSDTKVPDDTVNVNREYKSDIFKMYFSIKKNILDLYNAINGTSYTEEDEVTINTFENGVFMKIYNDVSFVISGTINLYEHQSTINPNMPLRDLYYINDMYKPFGMTDDLYGDAMIRKRGSS